MVDGSSWLINIECGNNKMDSAKMHVTSNIQMYHNHLRILSKLSPPINMGWSQLYQGQESLPGLFHDILTVSQIKLSRLCYSLERFQY